MKCGAHDVQVRQTWSYGRSSYFDFFGHFGGECGIAHLSSCFFGTVPTIIPADVSTLVHAAILLVIHDSVAEILIIPPRAPEVGVTVVALPARVLDLITYSFSDSDLSEDPPAPEHASSALTTSPFLHSSDSSETFRDSVIGGS
nr:hypothetical protein [Tanacetum cinerariifolium]